MPDNWLVYKAHRVIDTRKLLFVNDFIARKLYRYVPSKPQRYIIYSCIHNKSQLPDIVYLCVVNLKNPESRCAA